MRGAIREPEVRARGSNAAANIAATCDGRTPRRGLSIRAGGAPRWRTRASSGGARAPRPRKPRRTTNAREGAPGESAPPSGRHQRAGTRPRRATPVHVTSTSRPRPASRAQERRVRGGGRIASATTHARAGAQSPFGRKEPVGQRDEREDREPRAARAQRLAAWASRKPAPRLHERRAGERVRAGSRAGARRR